MSDYDLCPKHGRMMCQECRGGNQQQRGVREDPVATSGEGVPHATHSEALSSAFVGEGRALIAQMQDVITRWSNQASLLEQSAIRHRAISSVGLAQPEETSARELRNCIRQLEALLTVSGVPPWQAIETAPKDGSRVLLYSCEYKRHWFGSGYYFKGVPGDGEGWIAHSFLTVPNNDSSGTFEPSHWMPLPAPPAVSGVPQEDKEEKVTRVDGLTASPLPVTTAGENEPTQATVSPTSADELHAQLMSGSATTEVVRFAAKRLQRLSHTLDTLRFDLWNVAGSVVAACDSQQEHIASVACMEGSPLVDYARAVIYNYDLRNETTSVGRSQHERELRGDPGAPRTSGDDTRDKESLSSSMAAGLLLILKTECEAQHARAENAEADVLRLRAENERLERVGKMVGESADRANARIIQLAIRADNAEEHRSSNLKRALDAEAEVLRLRAEIAHLQQERDDAQLAFEAANEHVGKLQADLDSAVSRLPQGGPPPDRPDPT